MVLKSFVLQIALSPIYKLTVFLIFRYRIGDMIIINSIMKYKKTYVFPLSVSTMQKWKVYELLFANKISIEI